ncbi:hypothetical protein [Plantibacter sp. RU18]|uniref:hypothetical protein n=1 Tax=Plantibacter sp. RU18 TaxID=3158143 RepID=UPI003D35FA27
MTPMQHRLRFTSLTALGVATLILAGVVPANASTSSTPSFFGASAASADAVTLTDEQRIAVQATMSEGGIDAATQDTLLAKLASGGTLDASSGASPVSEEREDTGGSERTTKIYADGSRQWIDLQKPTEATAAGAERSGLSGCSASAGWNVNCKLEIRDIVSFASFVIDYQTSSAGAAKVRDMREKRCGNTVGSCTVTGEIKRATQSGSAPAWAELAYSANGGPVVANGSIGIRVTGTTVDAY